jgi:hypothetical protein
VADENQARWAKAYTVVQLGTIFFLIVGFFVTVRLEQERLTAIEMVVNGTLSKEAAVAMMSKQDAINMSFQGQFDILTARVTQTEQRLYEMNKQLR